MIYVLYVDLLINKQVYLSFRGSVNVDKPLTTRSSQFTDTALQRQSGPVTRDVKDPWVTES